MHGGEIAAEHADDVAEYGQDGNDAHTREHPGHDEVVDGTDRHDAQCVDLLRDLHRGDLRGNRRAHAPRADDADEDGAELTPDADSNDRADRALRAVADEFVRRLERQHNACKEKCQSDDEQGVRTEMRHLIDDAPHAQPPRDLPHGLSVEERDAPDIGEMREDKCPDRL